MKLTQKKSYKHCNKFLSPIITNIKSATSSEFKDSLWILGFAVQTFVNSTLADGKKLWYKQYNQLSPIQSMMISEDFQLQWWMH